MFNATYYNFLERRNLVDARLTLQKATFSSFIIDMKAYHVTWYAEHAPLSGFILRSTEVEATTKSVDATCTSVKATFKGARKAVPTIERRYPRISMQRAPLLLVSFALFTGCDMPSPTPAPVTLAVVNAHVWTGDARQPWAEAIAVSGDEIEAVGLGSEIRKRLDSGTHVIDAHGQMVVPGFIDSHIHFIDGGFRLASVQLRDARTPKEFVARIEDNALDLVERVVPAASPEMLDRALDAAMRYVAERGVTSVHNMGSWADLATFERAHHAGRLRTRIYAAVPLATWERLRDTVANRGRGDDWLHIGALKGFVDGSLGSHTAAFYEPFTDAPNDKGLLVNTPEDLYQWTSGADRAGLHVIVHAIGDRAIGLQLGIYERVARENGARDRRFRIEHAQHIAPADLPRFAALGVIPSMQPYHAIDDGRWAEKVIGPERIKTTYAFRSLRDAGARLAFGSDWFVAPPSPLEGIYAAVTRRTLDDKNPGGWVPEQKITVEDALRAYTSGAAYAEFAESCKGTLERGKLADFVILDRDLTRIAPETIRDSQVVMTMVGGKIVYESPSTP